MLERMDEVMRRSDERWDHVLESLDLLFAKVGDIGGNQQKTDTRVEMSTTIMEQMLKDQQRLAKQLDITSQAVTKLTLEQEKTSTRNL